MAHGARWMVILWKWSTAAKNNKWRGERKKEARKSAQNAKGHKPAEAQEHKNAATEASTPTKKTKKEKCRKKEIESRKK